MDTDVDEIALVDVLLALVDTLLLEEDTVGRIPCSAWR